MPFSPKTGDKLISNVVKQDYTTHPSAVLLWTTWTKLRHTQCLSLKVWGSGCGVWGQ